MPTPASVPPVPTEETKASTLPSVWGPAIGGVVELVGPDRAVRLLGGKLLGEAARVAHVVHRVLVGHGRHQDQLGAAQPQHVLLLLGLGLRHDDHRTVAQGVADQRQADPGIAGGALDDRAARR
jgi:hypothetical protein